MKSIFGEILLLKLILLSGILLFPVISAQSQFQKTLNYRVETGVGGDIGKNSPLWISANRQGLSSVVKNKGYLRAGVFRSLEKEKNFTYDAGIDLVGAYHYNSNFAIQQAYLGLHYYFISLDVGSKERWSELKDPFLSTGGMTFSGNSRPVPQVRVYFPEYVNISGSRDILHIRGHIAYGRFTDDNFQRDFTVGKSKYNRGVLYHSKAVFFKIGNNRFPLIFEGGIEMEAQFGGTVYHPNGNIEKFPSRFIDYLKVFIPMSGDETTSITDQVNITGNHLGSWHASLKYKMKDWLFRGYYEHFFEDHSQMFWEYGLWRDGLVGIEIMPPQNNFVDKIIYEFLYTKDQTGPFLHDTTERIPDQISGNDNYYNHVGYSSWSHWGMGIGNPLIISPLYNSNNSLSFRSNRIKGHHIGFSGVPSKELNYRFLFSYAKHWGTYYNPLAEVKYNINCLAEVNYSPEKIKAWSFTLGVGLDQSNLIGNSLGGMLTVKYRL